jgi:hypothetical protein
MMPLICWVASVWSNTNEMESKLRHGTITISEGHGMTKRYKITITCSTEEGGKSRGIAGVIYSPAWWKVFEYWTKTKFGGEGLNVTSITTEEIEPKTQFDK